MRPVCRSKWNGENAFIALDGLRSFGMGFFAIDFVLIATDRGLGAFGFGTITGVSVAIGMLITVFGSRMSKRFGSKVPMAIFGILMLATGILIAFSKNYSGIYVASLFGFLPPSGGLFISAITEGALAQSDSTVRTKVFAKDGRVVTVMTAFGALCASLPSALGVSQLTGAVDMALVFSGVGLLVSIVSISLVDPSSDSSIAKVRSGDAEIAIESDVRSSRFNIHLLTVLFAADAAGSGVITLTLIFFWLRTHFHFSTVSLSLLYFTMEILATWSFSIAVWLSDRFGPLSTAVFTHIPSSIFLILVPFAGTGVIAASLLLARSLLSRMDVPTRRSYMASIMEPHQRRLAASRTSMGKQGGRAIGPVVGGFALSSLGAVAPFLLGGSLKIAYDLVLWYSFKSVRVRD